MKEMLTQEVEEYIEKQLVSLQQARLDMLKNASFVDLFRGRNPYYLWSTRPAAHQLMRHVLDSYLAAANEAHFANFTSDLANFTLTHDVPPVAPSDLIEYLAHERLPLEIELLEEYDRASNRLTHQFFMEFCDEDARIDWERLTQFIVENDAAVQTL